MIDYRCTWAIVYLILSIIVSQESLAIEAEKSISNSDRKQLVSKQEDLIQSWQAKPQVLTQKTNDPESEAISKRWSLVGILVTSILFLFILRTLWSQDPNREKSRKTALATDEAEKFTTKPRFRVIESKSDRTLERGNSLLLESKIQGESRVSYSHRDRYPLLSYSPGKKQQIQLSNRTISPETTSAEESQNEAIAVETIVNSDITGKLTIVTSNTIEIDVVSELIRDLQPNNSIKNQAIQKRLRRKAIWELGKTDDFRAVEPLVQTIPIANSLEKGLILDAIARIAERNFTAINDVLLTSLSDSNAQTRQNAIQNLTSLYQSISSVTTRLSKMTGDRDREVRQTATWAIEQLYQISNVAISVEDLKSIDLDLVLNSPNFRLPS